MRKTLVVLMMLISFGAFAETIKIGNDYQLTYFEQYADHVYIDDTSEFHKAYEVINEYDIAFLEEEMDEYFLKASQYAFSEKEHRRIERTAKGYPYTAVNPVAFFLFKGVWSDKKYHFTVVEIKED